MLTHDVRWTHAPGTTCNGRLVCEYLDHWELRCGFCEQLFTAGQSVGAERQLCPARDERGLLGMLEAMHRRGAIVSYSVEVSKSSLQPPDEPADRTIVVKLVPRAWAKHVSLEIGLQLADDDDEERVERGDTEL